MGKYVKHIICKIYKQVEKYEWENICGGKT